MSRAAVQILLHALEKRNLNTFGAYGVKTYGSKSAIMRVFHNAVIL